MLSRIALKSAAVAPLLRSHINRSCVLAIASRNQSKDSSLEEMTKMLDNWDRANALYYGPDRDLKNFPHPTQPAKCPPTRIGVLPESWFTFFHEKTGVTGPYMFGLGMATFLISKELWVVEHQFTEFVTFWIAITLLVKKVGPMMQQGFNDYDKEYLAKRWDGPLKKLKDNAQFAIDETEKVIWREDGQKYLFEAKRENVDLQLEATYRKQLANVHQAVKKRLDYHVAIENTKTKFQQQHMVKWIVDEVVKGISPQQEKDSIKKCLTDLKAMAAKA